MSLNRKQKEKLAKKLLKEGKSTREISQTSHLSFRDIGKISRNLEGETKSQSKSMRSKAHIMFSKGKSTIQVLTILDIGYDEVKQYYSEYLTLKGMNDFVTICSGYQMLLPFLTEIAKKMIKKELFELDVNFLIDSLSDFKIVIDMKNKTQHLVNLLTVQLEDLESLQRNDSNQAHDDV